MLLHIGTYTEPLPHVAGHGQGIYTYRFDPAAGACDLLSVAAEMRSPSYLALNVAGDRLYAVQETDAGDNPILCAFAVDSGRGRLTLLNCQPAGGGGPCHLLVNESGGVVIAAHYGTGSVGVYPLLTDGRLGPVSQVVQHRGHSVNAERQEGPHAHGVTLDQIGRFLFVTDLGMDKVMVYRLDAGRLIPHEPPFAKLHAGAGPRHAVVHPNNRFVYVVNELDSTVTVFSHDAGVLERRQTLSALPDDFSGESWCGEIRITKTGRFVYASNRGHDSIAIFACHPDDGRLTLLGCEPTQGRTPRDFALTPDEDYLLAANQDSDTVVVFQVNGESGLLRPTGQVIDVPNPASLVMMSP